MLLKGPVILLFVGLTALTLSIADRSGRWLWSLRPLAGLAWMIALVLPWFIAIIAKSGAGFFEKAVGEDMLAKIFSGQESHGAPPGVYFLLFWVTFWPGSVLAGLAAPAVWQARHEPGARFLLAWLIPSWLVFEAVMTKLPHYVLPLYPAIAILIAGVLEGGRLVTARWLTRGTIGWFVFPVVVAIAVVVGFATIAHDPGIVAWPFAMAAAIAGLFAWWLYEVDGAERALLRGAVASVFIAITAYAVTFPSLPALFPSALIAEDGGRERLREAASRVHRLLPGAEPGLPARHRYAFHRCRGGRRIPASGAVPLRAHRRAQRAQLCAAGQCHRLALRTQAAH